MITQCRVCGEKKLQIIGSLGNIALSDFTITPQDGKKFPLVLVFCEFCGLLQLRDNPPLDEMYKERYWYESGINPMIVSDLKEIAEYVTKRGGIAVDIGANDGTLLSFVKAPVTYKIAVDPAKNLRIKCEQYCDEYHNEYWSGLSIKVDTITAIAMLYDLEDPNKFIQDVKKSLNHDGVFIAQLMTLAPMIENNDIGNVCHEHIEYYSYKSLVRLFEQNGLEIFKVEVNKVNGGSYRLFAKHYKQPSVIFHEKEYSYVDYMMFIAKVQENKKNMVEFLGKNKNQVFGFGASTKGNTILQYYGITKDLLPVIIDKNPNKNGRFTINTKIPILSQGSAKYYWALPWGLLESFSVKEGRFVVSTPEFKIC